MRAGTIRKLALSSEAPRRGAARAGVERRGCPMGSGAGERTRAGEDDEPNNKTVGGRSSGSHEERRRGYPTSGAGRWAGRRGTREYVELSRYLNVQLPKTPLIMLIKLVISNFIIKGWD